MQWTLPGTVLQIPRQEAANVEDVFSAMFLGGDIAVAQQIDISRY